MTEVIYEKINGKLGVRIVRDEFGLSISTMRNGYQWSGFPASEELMRMIAGAIESVVNQNPETQ